MTDQAADERDSALKKDAKEAQEKFDYVRFTFADTHGIARSKTVPRRNFDEFFESGITLFSG
jgi:glutamine synthetase